MAISDDLTLLRAVWVQAHADELAAFDLAAHAPTAANLTAVRSRITNDLTSIQGQLTTIVAKLPVPPPTRTVTAKVSTDTTGGRVDLTEHGFVASARRRDGGKPAVTGDTGWTGLILTGPSPGRDLTYLRPGATYVVGMQDATKGDWVSTTVTVPATNPKPPGPTPTPTPTGTDNLRAAFGASNGGGNDKPNYRDTTARHWTGLVGKTPPPLRWCYVEADPLNTDLLESVMADWTSDPNAISGAVRPHVRLAMGDSAHPCASTAAGSLDAGMRTTGDQLARLYAASKIPPRVALAWEWPGNWYAWSCGGIGGRAQVWEGPTMHVVTNSVADFIAAFKRSVVNLKQRCPQALIFLNGSVGWDGGAAGVNADVPDMSLAEQVVTALTGTISGTGTRADGQRWIDGFGGDLYNDGWPKGLANLVAVLAANKTFIEKHGLPWGMQELGIADRRNPDRIDTATFIHTVAHWMSTLVLDHFLVFDFGAPISDYSGWRGFSDVVTEGPIAVAALLAELGV